MGVSQKRVDGVARVVARAASGDELFESLATEIGKAIPYDGSMWFGVDPTTMLALGPGRTENLGEAYCQPFWHGEFHEHDVNLFTELAAGPVVAATLHDATEGRPTRSPRYRDFLQPQGYDDELRTVFRCGENTWGVAALLREAGRAPFAAHEVQLFADISATVAAALRTLTTVAAPAAPLHAPGLMVFDRDDNLVSANAEATRWLGDIYGTDDRDWFAAFGDASNVDVMVAVPIMPLLARARAITAGRQDGHARLRLRDRAGRWVVFHASVLAGPGATDNVAVVVEPAKSSEIAPIIIDAYGLTPRERDVVRCLAH
ncbi:MAG TPA: hypothetical protein VFG69_17820, partial [Nannocystaceae bacterium]|nr:hypothetical protein [Nannocystaceae bacterium]